MTRYTGTQFDDIISDTINDDQLYGGRGNDYLISYSGNDRMHGGAGNDVLQSGIGADRLNGDDGDDRLWDYDGHNPALHGGNGDDWVGGQGGLFGDAGNDTIDYQFGDATIRGGPGVDKYQVQMYAGEMWDDTNTRIIGLETSHTVTLRDFHPEQGEKLLLSFFDPVEAGTGSDNRHGAMVGDPDAAMRMFDSDHNNVLDKNDAFVDQDAAGDGINLRFWNVNAHIEHVAALTPDMLQYPPPPDLDF